MEKRASGKLLRVEIKLRVVDICEFEVPTELFFVRVKLEFPHLECHMLFIIYTTNFKCLKKIF